MRPKNFLTENGFWLLTECYHIVVALKEAAEREPTGLENANLHVSKHIYDVTAFQIWNHPNETTQCNAKVGLDSGKGAWDHPALFALPKMRGKKVEKRRIETATKCRSICDII